MLRSAGKSERNDGVEASVDFGFEASSSGIGAETAADWDKKLGEPVSSRRELAASRRY